MIYCCGEALIDMLPRRLASGEDVFLPVCGGAVFNTAIALGRLGGDVGFVSGISTDLFGEQLIEGLRASHVDCQACVRAERPSTLAFVRLSDGQAQYTFYDENSAGQQLAVADMPSLKNPTALHFGAISLIPEPCGSAYEHLMQRHQSEAVISLDPNIRPSFIDDAPRHRQRIERMTAMSDIVKVSDEDLSWIAPAHSTPEAIDRMLSDAGVNIVILTKGAEGLSAYTAKGQIDLPARSVEVVDTIGAGDSFNAGFLDGLNRLGLLSKSALEGVGVEDIRPALERAIEVAAITVSRAGANPPWARELNAG